MGRTLSNHKRKRLKQRQSGNARARSGPRGQTVRGGGEEKNPWQLPLKK
jgi:hypothetical protein